MVQRKHNTLTQLYQSTHAHTHTHSPLSLPHLQLSFDLTTKVRDIVPPTDVAEAVGQRTKVNLDAPYVTVLLIGRFAFTPDLKFKTLRLVTHKNNQTDKTAKI